MPPNHRAPSYLLTVVLRRYSVRRYSGAMSSYPGAPFSAGRDTGPGALPRVVLTRDPAQAGPLEAGLDAAGIQVGFLPMTEQRLPEDGAELRSALERLRRGDFGGLLLTSGNTVRALLAAGWEAKVPVNTWVGVVGPGTARVLADLTDVDDPWMPVGEKSAAGLLEELPTPREFSDQVSGEHILLPQSAQARPLLVEGVRRAGFQVVHSVAYETVSLVDGAGRLSRPGSPHRLLPAPKADGLFGWEELRTDDVLLVTSSSAAQACAAMRQRPRSWLLAIGEPTAQTLRALALPPAAVLREPSVEGLLDALDRGTPA